MCQKKVLQLMGIKRKYSWVILIMIFLYFVFKFIPFGFFDLGGDSAQYIILSESLASGKGFRAVNYPGEPFSLQYPPVFPILLLPIVCFWGRNFYAMHLLIALLGALSLLFLYKLFEKYGGRKIAFFTVLLFVFNWDFIFYATNYILSEVPYLAFSSATLLLFAYYSEKQKNPKILLPFILLAILLAFFSRYIGFTLFLGIAAVLLIKKEFKTLSFISLGFFIALLTWFVYGASASGLGTFEHIEGFFRVDYYVPYRGSVLNHPMVIISRFIDGANYNIETISRILFFPICKKFSLLEPWLSLIAIVAILSGFWLKLRQDKYCVIHYYFLIYLFFVMLVCYRSIGASDRYILPILPFIVFYLLSFLQFISKLLEKRLATLLFLTFCCLLFYSALVSLPMRRFSYQDLPISVKNFISVNKWIGMNIKEKATIFSRKATITYFYTNQKAIFYPYNPDDNLFWKKIRENNVRYIIIDEFSTETQDYLLPFMRRQPKDRFTTLYRLGNSGVLRIN
jgi:hypothetical protein